ncbi:MAG: hypothetical protein ACHQIL_12165 [Steroidobacterales bacterium]
MIETICLLLFLGAILFVALASPKPSGKDDKGSKDKDPPGN